MFSWRCFPSQGIDTPSLPAQGEQRRSPHFNIGRDIPNATGCDRSVCGSRPSTSVTPSSNQATTVESQLIQEIQYVLGQTLRTGWLN
jgi:hypothetical protein